MAVLETPLVLANTVAEYASTIAMLRGGCIRQNATIVRSRLHFVDGHFTTHRGH